MAAGLTSMDGQVFLLSLTDPPCHPLVVKRSSWLTRKTGRLLLSGHSINIEVTEEKLLADEGGDREEMVDLQIPQHFLDEVITPRDKVDVLVGFYALRCKQQLQPPLPDSWVMQYYYLHTPSYFILCPLADSSLTLP
jgi:hypothetical protein